MKRPALLSLCALLVAANSGLTQTRGGSLEVGAGVAGSITSISVGGQTARSAGPVFSGQIGLVASNRTDLTLNVAVQPYSAGNPARDERFSGIYSLVGVQVGFGQHYRTYLRPEVGIVFRSWTGPDVFTASERSLALGAALGHEFSLRKRVGVAPEVFVRISGADELATTLVGVSMSIVALGARSRRVD